MRFINDDKNVVRRVVVDYYFFFSAMVEEKKALLAKARKMICFLQRNFFSLLGKWENLFKLLWKLNDGTPPKNISISSWTLSLSYSLLLLLCHYLKKMRD